jgi:hypothetical protein
MPFTFPIDSNSKAGAVKATPDGNDFYVPTNPTLYNGSTFDKLMNNQEGILLTSATRTTATTAPTQTNYNAKGIMIFLNITAASGTGGIEVKLRGVDPVSGTAMNLHGGGFTITGAGLYVHSVYGPGTNLTGTSPLNSNYKWNFPINLPRTWSVQIYHNDASSYTYSVGYSYLL